MQIEKSQTSGQRILSETRFTVSIIPRVGIFRSASETGLEFLGLHRRLGKSRVRHYPFYPRVEISRSASETGWNISIFHGCMVWIEKSVTRVTDRHHEACLVMPNSDPE